MNAQKYTAAVIGLGRIGFTLGFDRKREQPASHTMALKANRRIRITAGCDTDAGRREAWLAANPGTAVYSSTAHLFAACRPDIVVVAVNEDAHLETAVAAIKAAPRLVILEKPVALNMADGLTIAQTAGTCGVPVLVNHERRFAYDYAAARDYMKKIGEIQSIHAQLNSGLRVYSPEDEKTGEYSLLHDGTHLVDSVLYLLGAVLPADALDAGVQQLLGVPVITGVCFDKDAETVVRNVSVHYHTAVCPEIDFSISGRSRFFGFEIDVLGTEGRIRIGNGFARFYTRAESRLYSGFYSLTADDSVRIPKKTGYFSNMIQNAVDFLDGRTPLRSTLINGLDTLAILDDIRSRLRLFCKK